MRTAISPAVPLRGAISLVPCSAEISQAVGFLTRVPRSFIHHKSPTRGKEITPPPKITHAWDPCTGHNIIGLLGFFLHSIKTERNPPRERQAKPCSCPWVRAGQIIAIKKKKRDMWTFISTNLGMQPAGGEQFTVARTLRNHTAQKYSLSSELPASPPVPPAPARGWDSLSPSQPHRVARRQREDTRQYCIQRFLCWRLNCRSAPPMHKTPPWWETSAQSRSSVFFPCGCNQTGRKTPSARLKRSCLLHERAFHSSSHK